MILKLIRKCTEKKIAGFFPPASIHTRGNQDSKPFNNSIEIKKNGPWRLESSFSTRERERAKPKDGTEWELWTQLLCVTWDRNQA